VWLVCNTAYLAALGFKLQYNTRQEYVFMKHTSLCTFIHFRWYRFRNMCSVANYMWKYKFPVSTKRLQISNSRTRRYHNHVYITLPTCLHLILIWQLSRDIVHYTIEHCQSLLLLVVIVRCSWSFCSYTGALRYSTCVVSLPY